MLYQAHLVSYDSMENFAWKENIFHSLWFTFKNKYIPLR